MIRKKVVAVDMDDTILFLMKAIHSDHNQKHPDFQVSFDKMVAFDDSMFHPSYDKMEFFARPGTFLNLELMDEHVVNELQMINEEYDLIIVTSSFAENVLEKWQWLQKYLPFIPHRNFCSFSRKDLIQADILIDDAIHNVKDWVATGRPALVPEHHWNRQLSELEGVTMFNGWEGMKRKIDNVLVTEEESLMMWLDHRLEHATSSQFRFLVDEFKKMWVDQFGSEDSIPEDFKENVSQLYLIKQSTNNEEIL